MFIYNIVISARKSVMVGPNPDMCNIHEKVSGRFLDEKISTFQQSWIPSCHTQKTAENYSRIFDHSFKYLPLYPRLIIQLKSHFYIDLRDFLKSIFDVLINDLNSVTQILIIIFNNIYCCFQWYLLNSIFLKARIVLISLTEMTKKVITSQRHS